MRYSLGIVWCTVLAGFVFSFCDEPTTTLFDSPFFSSPYTEVLRSTMHVWSDIRVVRSMLDNSYNQDDYNTCVYAILGQLLCIDTTLSACDTNIVPEDVVYLRCIVELMKQEATALSVIPAQAHAMQQLFVTIEQKLATLLTQSDDTSISSR